MSQGPVREATGEDPLTDDLGHSWWNQSKVWAYGGGGVKGQALIQGAGWVSSRCAEDVFSSRFQIQKNLGSGWTQSRLSTWVNLEVESEEL